MNIEEAINILTANKNENMNLSNHFNVSRFFEAINTLLTAYEKEKEKNETLEQENKFLKAVYRGTDEFKTIEKLAKE